MRKTVPFLLIAFASPGWAEDKRQLDSHEHGVGTLNIAVDGTSVAMEFHAPGADIVGFEYAAESAEDREAVDGAVATLARPLDLFVLPAAAECSVTEARAKLESEEGHEDHGHDDHAHDEDGHDDHGHDDHAHDEDEHADHGHDDHASDEHAHDEHKHDEHAHDDASGTEASHTEFHAEYLLTCGKPEALDEIQFAYFDVFENAVEVEVQIVTNSGAQAYEVERGLPSLDLRGLF